MAEQLKIKTVSGDFGDEEMLFSPEEMQPIEVAEALESDLVLGKTKKQVKKAQKLFGENDTRNDFRLSFRESLRNQLRGLTAFFLMIASFLMYLFKPEEMTFLVMAIVIGLIILLNAFAEFRASIALRLPKRYSSLKAKVIRDGEETVIDSRRLVPGDIITVEQGGMVPADCRLIDDMGFSVLETHVSGNRESVPKDSRYLARSGGEAICANMIYSGSIVTSGHATAIVCRIGKETLMQRMRTKNDDYTPDILKYVRHFCKILSVASIIASFLLLFVGVVAGADITEWFICSLAIGASSLCDSLISLCATSLGFGAKRMAVDGMVIKNYNCIRKLAKTNTIMCGKNLAFPPTRILLTGLFFSTRPYDREKRPNAEAEELLKLMLVCSDARRITPAERKLKRGLPEYVGSPLDDAIVDYFGEWNKPIGMIRDEYIRLDDEHTLSGDVSRILTLRNGKNLVIVRGSPENILSRCVGYTLDGSDYKLSDFTRKKILTAVKDYSRTNSFLVAVASGETEAETLRDIDAEDRLIFKGFVSFSGLLDTGVASSVYRCESAGIETVLNSNDAYYTALNTAKSAGIITDETQIVTAEQMRTLSRGLLIANTPYYRLFLNVDDGEWLDIIRIRRENGRITAVTAERINELPIMHEADISIVPESSCDTLRQTADALMLGKGINLIADGILNAKTICRRVRTLVGYIPTAIIMMFVASIFCVCYNQTPAFRAQDVLFGGIIFNLAFAFATAFEPRNPKNLREAQPVIRKKPTLNEFMYPLMHSIGAGIVLFVCTAATQSFECSLIALTVMLFLQAGSLGGRGGVIASKRFGSRLLFLCGLGVASFMALLFFTPLGRVFDYTRPAVAKLVVTLILSVGYHIATQFARYFMLPEVKRAAKKKAASKKAMDRIDDEIDDDVNDEIDEDIDEDINEEDYDKLEDDPAEESDKDIDSDEIEVNEDEDENEDNSDERSDEDDEDNG